MRMPFGEYKGQPITQVPKDKLRYYLKWDKLKGELRDTIEKVLAGSYVESNSGPMRQPYDPVLLSPSQARNKTEVAGEPPDVHDRCMKARRDGARHALGDVATEIDGLDIPGVHKSAVLNALLAVAQRLKS